MLKLNLFAFILACSLTATAQLQLSPDMYWVQFTDKANSPYSVDRPEEFLSPRAIARRTKQQIRVTQADLPVNASYITQVQDAGIEVVHVSKWFNAIVVKASAPEKLKALKKMDFVKDYTTPAHSPLPNVTITNTKHAFIRDDNFIDIQDTMLYDYGNATNQITMLNGHYLHNAGYRGQGIQIAVLDAGFISVDKLAAFDSIRANKQILGVWDFVQQDDQVYDEGSHGMQVLSTIAANIPGKMIGTAPLASFYLFRTENGNSEYLVEEANWIVAAERADSLGVDIITTSLGYTEFDDDAQNHTYQDLNGDRALISQGADMAAARGILVVTSAGNEGNDPWQYISAPADADSVLTIGAVDAAGDYAYFSSVGNTPDGRIKPNVTAQGLSTTVQAQWGDISTSSGTSFSCPVMAGMAACLWQSHPELTNMQLIKAIEMSASQFNHPDSLLGYGVPDFYFAYRYPDGDISYQLKTDNTLKIYPNPYQRAFMVEFSSEEFRNESLEMELTVFDLQGKKVIGKKIEMEFSATEISIPELSNLTSGVYVLTLSTAKNVYKAKLIKQ